MTYALAWALQEALYAALTADPAVAGLLGQRIFDAAPPAANPEASLYATLGDERAADFSTQTDRGAVHTVAIAVHGQRSGFADLKRAAGAITERLLTGPLPMARGRVVSVNFLGAETERAGADAFRRITLRLRIVVEDT